MVPALQLTDEEVLERLQKMLKGVSVLTLVVPDIVLTTHPLL